MGRSNSGAGSTIKMRKLRPFAILLTFALAGFVNQALAGTAVAGTYGYSVQQTSNYSLSGGAFGPFTLFSSSAAFQNGSPSGSESQGSSADALQSYVGPGAGRPAENTFTAKGMTTPDYARGDALLTAPSLSTASVAEAFMAGAGNDNGTGAWSISAPLTLSATGTVTVSFSFTNQLSLINNTSPAGAVAADFSYDFDIHNSSGTVV